MIGKRGENLRQISSQTGADLIRKGGNVYLASGTEEQRQHAKKCIIEMVVSHLLKLSYTAIIRP